MAICYSIKFSSATNLPLNKTERTRKHSYKSIIKQQSGKWILKQNLSPKLSISDGKFKHFFKTRTDDLAVNQQVTCSNDAPMQQRPTAIQS